MADKYNSMSQLYAYEPKSNYKLTHRARPESPVLILSPHGGAIEYPTSDLAREVAGEDFSLFDFAGRMDSGNFKNLHVTSRNYDCKYAKRLSAAAHFSLSFHGCRGKDNERVTFLGGADQVGRDIVQRHLEQAGFTVKEAPPHLSGLGADNIVNQNQRGKGIQLELSTSLRKSFVSQSIIKRLLNRGTSTPFSPLFYKYCQAVRNALLELVELEFGQ